MKKSESSDLALEAGSLVLAIRPILAGKDPVVQSAALADLVSMWLAGMFMLGDEKATERMRDESLKLFVETVKQLIPVNEAVITKPMLKKMFNQ